MSHDKALYKCTDTTLLYYATSGRMHVNQQVDAEAERCAIVYSAKQYRVAYLRRENVAFIEPQQPRFKSGGLPHLEALQEQVYHGRSSTTCTGDSHSIGEWRRRLQCVVD